MQSRLNETALIKIVSLYIHVYKREAFLLIASRTRHLTKE